MSGFNSVMKTNGGVIPRKSVLDKRKVDARRKQYHTSLMTIGESPIFMTQQSVQRSSVSQIQDDEMDMLSGLVNRINLHSSGVSQELEDDIDMLTNLVKRIRIKEIKKKRKSTLFTRVKKTRATPQVARPKVTRAPKTPRAPKVPKEAKMEYTATPSRSSTRPKTKPERLTYIR